MQFCPDAVFRKCVIELDIAKGKFVAKARFLAEAGWRALLGSKERDEENDGTPLPVVAKGDELLCEKGEVVERQTQPPRHFTDATLLSAMTGIARFVQDKDLKRSFVRPMVWGQKQRVPGLLNCCSSVVSSPKRALYPLHRRRKKRYSIRCQKWLRDRT